MFIVSPKWMFLNNKKFETGKSLLIDGPIIKDILDTKSVKKYYSNVNSFEYPNHILMPTFTESYIDMDDCSNETDIDRKIKVLLKNGVTRLQAITKDYRKLLSHNFDNNIDIGYMISFDGKDCNQNKITDIITMLDFFKSDPTKKFSFNLTNILDFENDIIQKIASISNEISINLHIQGDTLRKIKDKSQIREFVKFWDKINLLDSCYLHSFFNQNENWLSCMNKKSVKLMINYNNIDSIEKINIFLSLIEKKYTCILITDRNNTFNLYDTLKFISRLNTGDINNYESKIIHSITTNTSDIFSRKNDTGCIKKDLIASFNIFDYSINNFSVQNDSHKLCNLDNQSLSNVWSAGKQVIF